MIFVIPSRPTREHLIELARTDPEAIADLVLTLWDQVVELQATVKRLELKVAELERNTTRLPAAPAVNRHLRTKVTLPIHRSQKACGENRVKSRAVRKDIVAKRFVNLRCKTGSLIIASTKTPNAPRVAKSSVNARPGRLPWLVTLVRTDRSSICLRFDLK